MKLKVTLILRTYGRPLRTRRMLECIGAQTMNGIELLLMGDACPHFDRMICSEWFQNWKSDFMRKGNDVFHMNNRIGGKDWGAKVTNQAIKIARGKYTMFLDNDDVIKPEHCFFYVKEMERLQTVSELFAYCPVLVEGPEGVWKRVLGLYKGAVGHAELIVKTKFLKTMPPHEGVYGQDWILIEKMIDRGATALCGDPPFPTYVVMSSHNYQEPGMEKDK